MRWLVSKKGHLPTPGQCRANIWTLARHRAVAKQMPLPTEYHSLIAKEQTENTRPNVGSTLTHRRRMSVAPNKGPALRAQTANRAHSKHGTSTHCRLNAGPPSRR